MDQSITNQVSVAIEAVRTYVQSASEAADTAEKRAKQAADELESLNKSLPDLRDQAAALRAEIKTAQNQLDQIQSSYDAIKTLVLRTTADLAKAVK